MRMNVKMPRVSDTIDEVIVIEILVSVGDHVESGSPLLRVDADKATVDVPAPADGTVVELLVDVDDDVATGTRLVVLDVSE